MVKANFVIEGPSKGRLWKRCILVVLITAAVIATARWKFVDVVRVRGASMAPLIGSDGGWLLIDRRSGALAAIKYGDVVVFADSEGSAVKRVTGQAGDSISIRRGDVWIARTGQSSERLVRSDATQAEQRVAVFPAPDARLVIPMGITHAVDENALNVTLSDNQSVDIEMGYGPNSSPAIRDHGPGANGLRLGGTHDVNDVRIKIQNIVLKSTSSLLRVVHRLSTGSIAVEIANGGIAVVRTEGDNHRRIEFPGTPTNSVTLDTLDGWVRVGVPDGDATRWLWSEPRDTTEGGPSTVQFYIRGAVSTDPIAIDRDVHYVAASDSDSVPLNQTSVYVPEGYVYLLGDQPSASRDSRHVGCISLAQLRGKVISVLSRRGNGPQTQ